MLNKRIIISLAYFEGTLYRTKNFLPDYRYTDEFISNKYVDEIILLDISQDISKTKKKIFYDKIRSIAKNCFVPITVGGKISSFDQIKDLQANGADRIVVNSIIFNNPDLIKKIVNHYGSQFIIGSIDVKKNNDAYSCFINNGTKMIVQTVDEVLEIYENLKIGEILINSIDQDGALTGFDIDICKYVKKNVSKPIIAMGGCGNWPQVKKVIQEGGVDAIGTSNIFHFTEKSIYSLKSYLKKNLINVRI